MATAPSLFGANPEDIQQQRNAVLNTEAAQYAQMDPFQRANFGIYKGANQLGGVVGGMLGGQDPQMMRASQRQQLLQGVDTTNPQALIQAAQKASQAGDYQAAQELSTRANALQMGAAKLQSEQALTTQRMREREGADPIQQLLRANVFTPDSVASYQESGNIRDLVSKDPKLQTQVVETREGQILIDKATGQPIANIGKSPERGVKVSTSVTQAPDIVQAVSAFDKSVAPYIETRDSAQTVQGLLNDARGSNNAQAFEAARTTLAKAIGQNKLSNEDIKRTGIDPRLVAGALDWVNKKIVGVPNDDVMKQMFAVSKALELKATERIDKQAQRTQAAATAQGFKGDQQLFFPQSTPAPQGGDAAKEARYQAWKQQQGR